VSDLAILTDPAQPRIVVGRSLSADRVLQVSVRNPMLAEALEATARKGGWDRVDQRGELHVLVTDVAPVRPRGRRPGNRVVLVCEPTPHSARRAMDAVSEFLAAAIVCADQPADLAAALAGIENSSVSIPMRVLDLAATMPELSERQLVVIGAVMAGQSNAEIGRGLYLSPGSVKREMGILYHALGSSGRSSLVARAMGLGLEPRPVRP